ncbi:hypothetical protein DMB38_15140 [Streptomyces sp. WAC 06738]|nr:hypothetical protein DMB38_15140 [Streptomyces sp. WAC 06738]
MEYMAVSAHLSDLERINHPAGTIFECGRLPGTPWHVYLAETGEGNANAAVITERAINAFRPAVVLFTGVAGRMKHDIELGDVVVSTRLAAYHGGKQDGDQFKARPQTWETSHALQQIARYVNRDGIWHNQLPQLSSGRTPQVHLKPVLAGEVVLDSAQSDLRQYLEEHYNGSAAIEMEGAGAAGAAHLAGALPFLVIRGISDAADGSKQSSDADGWQEVGARHAAAFTIAMIRALPAPTQTCADGFLDEPVEVKQPSVVPITDPVWRALDSPATVKWRSDIQQDWWSIEPPTLEVHLVPVGPMGRLDVRRLHRLRDELLTLGRAQRLFLATEQVDVDSTSEHTVVGINDPRGRNRALAVLRSGQRTTWELLPKPGISAIIDVGNIRQRLTYLLGLLCSLDLPAVESFAPAVGISQSNLIEEGRLDQVNPNVSHPCRMTKPARVGAEELITASEIVNSLESVAEELSLRLVHAFREVCT